MNQKKNISSAAKRMKQQKTTTQTDTSKNAMNANTVKHNTEKCRPASTSLNGKTEVNNSSIQTIKNQCKGMEKITLSQLLEKQQTLAAKVIALQEIENFEKPLEIKTEVDSENSFRLSVSYGRSWHNDILSWTAERKDYGDDKDIHANEEAYDAMTKAIDEALTVAEARANTIIAKIASIFKK